MNRLDCNTIYAFSLEEVLQKTPCSPESVEMREFLKPVIRLLGYTSRKNSLWSDVVSWLEHEGYLFTQKVKDSKCSYYVLTSRGKDAGLLEMPIDPAKNSTEICCGSQGKRFLLESLEQILAMQSRQWAAVEACLTPEFLGSISCGTDAEAATGFLNRINDKLLLMHPDLPQKFTVFGVNAWLVKQGLLEDIFRDGGWRRGATEAGEAEGIISQRSMLENGKWKTIISDNYTSYGKKNVLWTQKGKQFILAHLRDIAQDLGTGVAYQHVPLEFSMTEEQRARFSYAYAEKALSYSGITKWLNSELWPIAGVRLPSFLVGEWLANGGFLKVEERPDNKTVGRTMRVPTERGKAIGLVLVDEEYRFTAFQLAARHYIVGHLEEIVAYWQGLERP